MRPRSIILVLLSCIILAAAAYIAFRQSARSAKTFDKQIAFQHVVNQVNLGPRFPGSVGHADEIQYITDQLNRFGWTVEIQQGATTGLDIQNIIASRDDTPATVILGAHYDTRRIADRDPNVQNQNQPVPGANDGGSGVAVLLEIARVLPKSTTGVRLVFFDLEDQGGIDGQDWSQGAAYYVKTLVDQPDTPRLEAVIIVDMIGDADQQVYYEQSSDQKLREEIWRKAAELGYAERIIPQVKHSIIDDHIPFLNAGIPAADMIDIDYTYWHTVGDTPDKVSPESLEAVGKTLLKWLAER